MALETLKNIKSIDGYNIYHWPEDGAENWFFSNDFIKINHGSNLIQFMIQSGPINSHGENGCQVDTILETCKAILKGLDKKLPCDDNKDAIAAITQAVLHLKMRRHDRELRGVEGSNQL